MDLKSGISLPIFKVFVPLKFFQKNFQSHFTDNERNGKNHKVKIRKRAELHVGGTLYDLTLQCKREH